MKINVPDWAAAYFWEEPPEGHSEFWSFRFPPPCKAGDTLHFLIGGSIVASATVAFIEPPGQSKCAGTGRFGGGYKVYWRPDSFRDLRRAAPPKRPTPRDKAKAEASDAAQGRMF